MVEGADRKALLSALGSEQMSKADCRSCFMEPDPAREPHQASTTMPNTDTYGQALNGLLLPLQSSCSGVRTTTSGSHRANEPLNVISGTVTKCLSLRWQIGRSARLGGRLCSLQTETQKRETLNGETAVMTKSRPGLLEAFVTAGPAVAEYSHLAMERPSPCFYSDIPFTALMLPVWGTNAHSITPRATARC